MKLHLHHFSKIKIQKESQNRRNQGFSYYFCMMIEGSGAGSGSGSIPLTSGSGSWRPKNTWIRWIRIRNTVVKGSFHSKFLYIFNDRQILLCTVISQQVFLLEIYHENGYDARPSSCQKFLGADEFISTRFRATSKWPL